MICVKAEGSYLINGKLSTIAELSQEQARNNTITYQILKAHDKTQETKKVSVTFDSLISEDPTYVGIIQMARESGMMHFPVPFVMTNCHNSLNAVGGTVNEDDHVFGLSAAKKYGGIYVPANFSVMHAYAKEELVTCGDMILGSDSHTRYGALGTMGFGEGGAELVKQLLNQPYDIPSPHVVLCYLSGKPKQGIGPEDIALAIIGATFKNGVVKNNILEFTGPGLCNLSADYRCNIDTMMTETACLSTIWETDVIIEEYYKTHGRIQDYKQLKAKSPAYYDSVILVDLDKIESMIAMPFHPSNVYTIHDFQQNAKDILAQVDIEANQLFGKNKLKISRKYMDGKVYADQGCIVGCVGGLFENISETAAILRDFGIGKSEFSLMIYPASMPVNLELMRIGALDTLISAGAVIKPCICGPCVGCGDIPANNAFSIRHATRNFPNREGSLPLENQYAAVALMDARSIAATAVNGGAITAATDMDYKVPLHTYHFDRAPYEKKVHYGFKKGDSSIGLVTGPNISDFPPIPELAENLLMELSAVFHDLVITTDDLIPSGEATSYRSNPVRLADYTLSRRAPGYADLCKAIQLVESERRDGKQPPKMLDILSHFGDSGNLIRNTQLGSCMFACKPGDGSAREQAASSQRILGSVANICYEYATKRYRSNCINWGIIPFTISKETSFDYHVGDFIFVANIRRAIMCGKVDIHGLVLKADGGSEPIVLHVGDLSNMEREIILSGCLMNYYRQEEDKL